MIASSIYKNSDINFCGKNVLYDPLNKQITKVLHL